MRKIRLYTILIIFVILFSGCKSSNIYDDKNKIEKEEAEPVSINNISNKEKEEMILYIEKKDYKLNLYEPEKGVYLGAYVDLEDNNSIKNFESLVEKEHAIYTYNIKLKQNTPSNFILKCISRVKTPNIIVTPADYKNPFDETYLEEVSKDYGELYVPIFLNFYPYESDKNYNKEEYIKFYRKVREIFKKNAANVAFVWTVDEKDVLDSYDYYPGDEYVDWVGINLYNTLENKEDTNKDIFNILDYFYYTYQGRKPIMISKLGISHFSKEDYVYKTTEASREIEKIYNKIVDEYHNIKSINYININEINKQGSNKKYNFSVTEDEDVLKSYKDSIKREEYLSLVNSIENKNNIGILLKSPFFAYKIENNIYISKKSFTYNLRNIDLNNKEKYLMIINNEEYYNLYILKEFEEYETEVENNKIFIKNKKVV